MEYHGPVYSDHLVLPADAGVEVVGNSLLTDLLERARYNTGRDYRILTNVVRPRKKFLRRRPAAYVEYLLYGSCEDSGKFAPIYLADHRHETVYAHLSGIVFGAREANATQEKKLRQVAETKAFDLRKVMEDEAYKATNVIAILLDEEGATYDPENREIIRAFIEQHALRIEGLVVGHHVHYDFDDTDDNDGVQLEPHTRSVRFTWKDDKRRSQSQAFERYVEHEFVGMSYQHLREDKQFLKILFIEPANGDLTQVRAAWLGECLYPTSTGHMPVYRDLANARHGVVAHPECYFKVEFVGEFRSDSGVRQIAQAKLDELNAATPTKAEVF